MKYQAMPSEELVIYPVNGCAGYFAACDGSVFRVKGDRHPRRIVEQAQTLDREGYPRVKLTVGGKRSWIKVAKVIALAFLPPKPTPIHQLRHMDGNNKNNAAWNLLWGTPKENANDRDRHGTTAKGSRHGVTELNESQVIEIRACLSRGEKQKTIAKSYMVSQATVSRIKRRVYWRHI